MAPHLTLAERDLLAKWSGQLGLSPLEVHEKLSRHRAARGVVAPNLTNVRKALKGLTYKCGVEETRGRPRLLTRADVLKMNRLRLKMISDSKIGGRREVHWAELIQKAGVPNVAPSTARLAFKREGFDVKWRAPRQKPQRTQDHMDERREVCGRWRYLPATYFTDSVDLVIDNKSWECPVNVAGRQYLMRQKIRGHLRLPSEGLNPAFTKPNSRKHRMKGGKSLKVCAGIVNSRVAVWHYIDGPWNGETAASTYRDVLFPALKRRRGAKRSYKVLEDNDPTGYKSNKAIAAKKELGIQPIQFPRYSPDLNPLDFFLWSDIQGRLDASAPRGKESRDKFKERLRRTALATSPALIKKALESIKERVAAVHAAGGADIPRD